MSRTLLGRWARMGAGLAAQPQASPTRRTLIAGLGAALAGCAGPSPTRSPKRRRGSLPTSTPSVPSSSSTAPGLQDVGVAIVGAGLAGLTCCHRLAEAGVVAQVYEASGRVGGRTYSADLYGDGQVLEMGGEFINSSDHALIDLIDELGLRMNDLCASGWGLESRFYYQGSFLSADQVWGALWPLYTATDELAAALVPWPQIGHLDASPGAVELDMQSLAAWLEGVELNGLGRSVVDTLCRTEFGAEAEDLSALNVLKLLGVGAEPTWDECYRLQGGVGSIAERLAALYEDRVTRSMPLEAIRESSDGRYVLSFGSDEVVAGAVVLALPFSVLRQLRLDVPLSPQKRDAIDRLSYGTNAKLLVPFRERFWKTAGTTGFTMTDLDYQMSWDGSEDSSGAQGVLTQFVGGQRGASLGALSLDRATADFLAELEQLYPGCSALRDLDKAPMLFHWPSLSTAEGSYSAYGVAEWTQFGGAQATREGGLFFAGEHTSTVNQGYMIGAVESGIDAAFEVLGARRLQRAPTGPRTFRGGARW
jgi:monoamine oxidase